MENETTAKHFKAQVMFGSLIALRQSFGVLISEGVEAKMLLDHHEEEGFVEALIDATPRGNIDNHEPEFGVGVVVGEIHYPSDCGFGVAMLEDLVEFKNIQWGDK